MSYHDEEEESDLDPSEYPEPDSADDDWSETVPCPYCRRPVYEDAERCPECGHYLSREGAPTRHPVWILVGVVLCLLVALGWALGC